jgi:hypothetical protein
MTLCSALLACAVSFTAPVSDFSLRSVDQRVCVAGGAADGRCFTRPPKIPGEVDLRARLQRFEEVYDANYRPKDPSFQTSRSTDEGNAKIKAAAAGGGVTTEQRRHLLATYARIGISQVGFDPGAGRPLKRDNGDDIFEIPFVAQISVVRTGQSRVATVTLRGRLEIPPDMLAQILTKQFSRQADLNAAYARLVELDARAGDALDDHDLLREIIPAALSQIYVEHQL